MGDFMYFLCKTLQQTLEEAEQLFNEPADETKPYDNKYKARELLKNLLTEASLLAHQDDERAAPVQALIYLQLAVNYFDTEESGQADEHFKKAMDWFEKINDDMLPNFYNYLQELYNSIGIILANRDEAEKGIAYFAKAEHLYNVIKEHFLHNHNDYVNNFQTFAQLVQKESTHQHYHKRRPVFSFYYQGGNSLARTEKHYTLTLFYMAQAYTKLELKDKAADYCGKTMQRQFELKEYELKDFCVNCISLAEYYQGNHNFCQAEYLLLAAISILPEGKKKKLHATLYMALGRYCLEFMKYCVARLRSEEDVNEALFNKSITKQVFVFKGIQLDFPHRRFAKDIEDVKGLFRAANTQYKKALQYFVFDGYVTEHLQIIRDQSQLYRQLMLLETDGGRSIAMLERRKETLELAFKTLNPKAYARYYEELLTEMCLINMELFERKFDELSAVDEKKKSKQAKQLELLNKLGEETINMHKTAIEILEALPADQKNDDYALSVINSKFNIAKIYPKLFTLDTSKRVENLTKSLQHYTWVRDYIKSMMKGATSPLSFSFSEQLRLCEDMCDLLPLKISKVNAGVF